MRNQDRGRFLGVIGKVDGTDIVLQYKPGGVFHGEHFYSRKKLYAIDLCAVCDSQKCFIYSLVGFSNITHDSRVCAATQIHQHLTRFFTPGQYLLGDSADSPTKYMVPPYKAPYTSHRSNRKFNRRLSSIHIDIEHAFGMLKDRWKSLTELRLIFTNHQQYEYACMWITACMVLHNILLDLNDTWDEKEGWWTEEELEEYDEDLFQRSQQEEGEGVDMRETVKQLVLEW